MAADFSHDDLMFATRLARMGGGRDRRGLELLAAMSGGGGGNRGEQTDALVGALVQSALAERQARVEAGLRRAAADSDWEKRRAAAVEDRDAGSARFFAELGARKSEREGDRTFQSTEAERADTRRAKASAADFERANQAADARADRQSLDRINEQIAVFQVNGDDIPPVLLEHRAQLSQRLGVEAPTTQPSGGGAGGLPRAMRQGLSEKLLAEGDIAGAVAARSAKSAKDIEALPAVQAEREQRVKPLLDEAAKMLDENHPGYVAQLFGSTPQPWQEPSGIFEKGTWVNSADQALERAQALQTKFAKFRAFGITPEEIVDHYRRTKD